MLCKLRQHVFYSSRKRGWRTVHVKQFYCRRSERLTGYKQTNLFDTCCLKSAGVCPLLYNANFYLVHWQVLAIFPYFTSVKSHHFTSSGSILMIYFIPRPGLTTGFIFSIFFFWMKFCVSNRLRRSNQNSAVLKNSVRVFLFFLWG